MDLFRRTRKFFATVGIVAIIASIVVVPTASAQNFDDDAYQLLKDAGIVAGAQNRDVNASRRAFAKVLVGVVLGTPDAATEAPAPDVPLSDPDVDYLAAAKAAEIMLGDDGTGAMRPDDQVNRYEMTTMLARALGLDSAGCDASSVATVFADGGSVPSWAASHVCAANEAGVVTGRERNGARYVDGTSTVVRAEMFVANARVLEGGTKPPVVTPPVVEPPVVDPDAPVEPAPSGGTLTVAAPSTQLNPLIIPDGTAFNPLASFNFTAGSTAVDLTGLTVTKGGFVADTAVKLSVWANGMRHGSVVQVSSEHTSIIGFATDPIRIAAGKTVTVTVAANLVSTIDNGTVVVSLASMDMVESTADTVIGTFPFSGNTVQITNGETSVAAATFDVRSLRTTSATVDIGQKDYEITRFEINETSSREDLLLTSLTLFNNGSSADADLQNLKLKDQSGNVIATKASTSGKYLRFDLVDADGAPAYYTVPLGTTRVFSVELDIVNGATRTAQLAVQNDFDVGLKGSSTGASILAGTVTGGTDTSFPVGDATTGNAGFNLITINEGTLTITKDNSSLSGDLTKGGNSIKIATFRVQAVGEDVELQKAALDLSNGTDRTAASNTTGYFDCVATATCDLTGTVKLVTDGGKTLMSINADTTALWNATNNPNATAAYTDLSAFHTIKAGMEETLHIVANISSGSNLGEGETVQGRIAKLYFYKKSSLKFADSAASSGNTLTSTVSSLTVSKNAEHGDQTVVSGTSGVKLGSFFVRAGSSEGVNITSLGVQVNQLTPATAAATGVTNLKLMKVSLDAEGAEVETQVGTTQSTVSDSTTVSFSTSGLNVPASGQIEVRVYGDVSSSVGTDTLITTIPASAISGSAAVSTTATSGPTAALTLQTVTGATGGQLNVVTASGNPLSNILVAGSTSQPMLSFQATASQAEAVRIKEVIVRNDANADDVAVGTLGLYSSTAQGGAETLLGSASFFGDGDNPGYATWSFSGTSRPTVPSQGTLYFTVRMNVVSSGQTEVTGLTPRLALGSIKAEGVNQVTPYFVASGTTSTDSTANLPDRVTAAAGAVNDTGCDLNGAITAAATTITIDNGGAGTCDGTSIPAGVVLELPTTGEEVLVTAATATSLTVVRGVGAAAAAAALDDEVINYGSPVANALNTVVVAYNAANASFTTAATFDVGQVIRIDNEDMTVRRVVVDAAQTVNPGLIYVTRAANNTTLAAHATASTAVNEWAAIQSNVMVVAETKPTFTAATGSPSGSGALSVNSELLVGKLSVAAATNAADNSQNNVTLTNLDVKMSVKTGVNVSSVTLYPSDEDKGSNSVAGTFLSANSLRFLMTGLTSSKNVVNEGQTRVYNFYANVPAHGASASLKFEIANLGSVGTGLGGTALGGGDTTPDIQWSDGAATPSTFYWVKQDAINVAFNASPLVSANTAAGTLDVTAPTITTFLLRNDDTGGTANTIEGGCTTAVLSTTANCDSLVVTFSENISPGSINSGLLADGTVSVVGVATGSTGGLNFAWGTNLNPTTLTNIASFNYHATAANAGATRTASTNLSLNSAGTVLTVWVNTLSGASLASGTPFAAGDTTAVTTTVTDLNAVALADAALNTSGTF